MPYYFTPGKQSWRDLENLHYFPRDKWMEDLESGLPRGVNGCLPLLMLTARMLSCADVHFPTSPCSVDLLKALEIVLE